MNVINLDHISFNPLLPEVREAMIDAINNKDLHNPSSQHKAGEKSAEMLAQARQNVADLINAADPKEVVFTSGGTESVNHAVKGAAMANREKGNHIIATNIEHNSVIRSLKRLSAQGFKVTSLSVDESGRVDPAAVADAITDQTILISVMHSNNETGTIQPIAEIGAIARENKVLFHCDAVDSVGVVPVDVQALNADLLSFASNPFYGPTGAGGLYIRRGTRIFPLLDGGVQEHNKRAGTENLIGIIGMGKAAQLAAAHMEERRAHLADLKKYLVEQLPQYVDEYIINTNPDHSLPNLLNISLKYIEGESVMLMLDEENLAVSTKSACATGSLRASHVLLSLGLSHSDAQGTLVIAWGIDNSKDDLQKLLSTLSGVVSTLRSMSPLYQK
ncbi:cysteine desulfurase [Desulfosalsimonas propionicica]|uniref:cysteine desulfurase n=1 Tax=Desulfosalsimonas propionicica TaxID=332175 RepID=A0A7W0C8U0_9BACT|nr:cysteine desulfurase family protein [Desulfosalsimonas propionicica]MBA2881215.1 cysteine desulfurase [Desulfosalsimonas propionicica]